MKQAVGRFAPSPSGRMHLGNVFSALLAWLSVRAQGGRIILRIEDLDPERSRPEYIDCFMRELDWLGLNWDEGPGKGSPNNPYLQSERTPFYEECLANLAAMGLVYPCFCSRAELHAPNAPHLSDGTFLYSGKCRDLNGREIAEKSQKRKPALRIRVPDTTIGFTDGCQGYYKENLARDCGDFILRRSDGIFAYQLAVSADDGAMGVTEVVRGKDLLASTPRQIWLMGLLGYPPPRYCHLPLLLAPDGRRLSKRDKDLDLGHIRMRAKKPQPLIGALAHLAGLLDKPEPLDATDLVPFFSWEKVHRDNIVIPGEFA